MRRQPRQCGNNHPGAKTWRLDIWSRSYPKWDDRFRTPLEISQSDITTSSVVASAQSLLMRGLVILIHIGDGYVRHRREFAHLPISD